MKKTKTKKNKVYHLLMYVEDSAPKIKKFSTKEKAGKFVEEFHKNHPDHLASDSGYWIDYLVSEVSGDVYFFTDGIKVE